MTIVTLASCKVVVGTASVFVPAAVGSAIGGIMTGGKLLFSAASATKALGASTATGMSTGAIAGLANNPVGMLVVGTCTGVFGPGNDNSEYGSDLCVTYDCWKPIVHDESLIPSRGMLLKDLCCHPDVACVNVTESDVSNLPHVRFENKWNEIFEIEYMLLPDTNQLFCHANPIVKSY
ncbi:uncharacterized protein LOC127848807 isoform X2 [Dreissena polymorpha]|uniref:Uncharacterized protein n=1 Tax=Dreissena polymorpha TaxID=45954 RepID=A0A9D4DHD1_DREPO|nr:uncharacterized protein LOC127848807 isoform X2 [Dreissena polymorpha]XP_052237401.1 uncharacterized protein LOC127848807 isoform X2 [Dreissena polymorpha]KAH3748918.1 hypothetical protein DPMN_183407 [Dreissena polymorpha]